MGAIVMFLDMIVLIIAVLGLAALGIAIIASLWFGLRKLILLVSQRSIPVTAKTQQG
jgi:hypothetical protein